MTNAELIAEIRRLATELNGDTGGLPALSRLRKPALEQLRDGMLLNLESRNQDQAVNEAVDGAEIMTRWLALPATDQHQTAQWHRDNVASTPSPMREYQSSQEALAVLDAHLDAAETGDEIDPEFAAEVDVLVARDLATDLPPASVFAFMPVTEIDVKAAGVTGLVQWGKRLVWAKLISVVNRRTSFSPAFLVTVEFEGVRRLVKADHYLAA